MRVSYHNRTIESDYSTDHYALRRNLWVIVTNNTLYIPDPTVFSARSSCYDHTPTPNGSDEADDASGDCPCGKGEAARPDGPSRLSASAITFAPKLVSPGGLSVFAGTHDERAPPGVSWDCVAVLLRECGKAIGSATLGSAGSELVS